MSNSYRYWKPEGKAVWKLCEDSERGISAAIAQGAMFHTVLSIDQDVDQIEADTKVNYKGPLYFDIDAADETHSLTDCRRLLLTLYKDYGINLSQLTIHCTGGKGFHILVPAKMFGTNKAAPHLPYTYKNMAVTFALEHLDYGIYSAGKGRMWRIENLERETGRFKVALTVAQIFSLPFEEIYKLTMFPGPPTSESKTVDFSAELSALFKRSEYKPSKVQTVPNDKLLALTADPACVRKILNLEGIKEARRFNQVIMAVAAYAVGKGWSMEVMETRCAKLIKEGVSSAYKSPRDRLAHVRSMYRYFASAKETYHFACLHMQNTVDVLAHDCPNCLLMSQVEADEYDPNLGLMIINSCFYKRTESGKTQLTTFNVIPTSVIEYLDSPDSEYTIHTTLVSCNKLSMNVVFSQQDWGSKNSFIKKLPHPDFAYLGGDTDVSRLFHVLGQVKVPKKIGVRTIGMHAINGAQGDWHFACQEGSLGPRGEVDDLMLESDYHLSTKLLKESPISAAELKELIPLLFRFNGIEITVPLMGWFVATFYKERLFTFTRQFPLLFIFGAAGAGKTQTILALKNMFALGHDNIKSIADLTPFTLIKSASASNTIPLMLDEFKSTTFSVSQVKMVSKLIRAAYNNESGERGTASQRIIQYFYKAPIIIAGEQTVSEPAAKERILEVHLTKRVSAPHLAEFEKLQASPMSKLGKSLLMDALAISQNELKNIYDESFASVPSLYRDRPRVNLAVMLTGLRMLERLAEPLGMAGFVQRAVKQYWEIKEPTMAEEVLASSKSDVDRILEAINIMAENQRTALYPNLDFVIENGILKINMALIYTQFLKFASEYQLDTDTPNYASFLKLIRKEPYFLKNDQPTKLGNNIRLCMHLDVIKLRDKNLSMACILEPQMSDGGGELKIEN